MIALVIFVHICHFYIFPRVFSRNCEYRCADRGVRPVSLRKRIPGKDENRVGLLRQEAAADAAASDGEGI